MLANIKEPPHRNRRVISSADEQSSVVWRQRGFTVIELITTVTLVGILTASFLTVFGNFLVTSTRTNATIEMTNDSQNLLRVIVEELRYGAGVRQINSIVDSNAPAGGWNTGNSSFVIITAVPALDADNNFIIDPETGGPYLNEFVYFKQGTDMYKRTLAHPSASGNKLKTSCPAAIATGSCPADRKLVENMKTMSFVFYDQDNATVTDPTQVRSINISLTLEKKSFGSPITFDNSIRTTLRNVYQ